MRSRDPWLILLFALPLMGGCLGYFVAESRPFVAVVPVAPGAVRYRAVVSSYRAGFGYQAP